MTSRNQMEAVFMAGRIGYRSVYLPTGDDTPTPGIVLMAKPDHRELLLVQSDGRLVDLMELHRAALDVVRNWHGGDNHPLKLPHFIGDFKRLTVLANAVNGTRLKDESVST